MQSFIAGLGDHLFLLLLVAMKLTTMTTPMMMRNMAANASLFHLLVTAREDNKLVLPPNWKEILYSRNHSNTHRTFRLLADAAAVRGPLHFLQAARRDHTMLDNNAPTH